MKSSLFACSGCTRRLLVGDIPNGAFRNGTNVVQRRLAHSTSTSKRSEATLVEDAIRDAPTTLTPSKTGGRIAREKRASDMERMVHGVLKLYENPYRLQEHVALLLKKDRYDEALLFAQKASKDQPVTVAWNNLIQYQMTHGKTAQAIKTFNDMKKRAQLPNARTYTILFQGLKSSQHPKWAVGEAVKHYNVLLADTRIEANSFHMNAVLNVCARAEDLDNLFLISQSANETTRQATAFTYTIILNALRHADSATTKALPREQRDAHLVKVVQQAKGLWVEVMDKWRKGQLFVDEELVCCMGRLLMLEPKQEDKFKVLELLEQTMKIPNLAATPDSPLIQDPEMKNIAAPAQSGEADNKKPEVATPMPPTSRYPKPNRFLGKQKPGLHIIPGCNTLGLVMLLMGSTKSTHIGIKYWNLMVRHYGIVPDMDVWLRLLGMLRRSNSSSHTAAVIEYLPNQLVVSRVFCLAMETCVLDHRNPNVMENANTILAESLKRMKIPDLQTLRLYLRTALVSHSPMRKQAQDGAIDLDTAIRDYGLQITAALKQLDKPFHQIHRHYFKHTKADIPADERILYNDKREVMALARLMCSAYDKVINQAMLPEEQLAELRRPNANINAEVRAFYAGRTFREPKLHTPADDQPRDWAKVTDTIYGEEGKTATARVLKDEDGNGGSLWGPEHDARMSDYIWDVKKARTRASEPEEIEGDEAASDGEENLARPSSGRGPNPWQLKSSDRERRGPRKERREFGEEGEVTQALSREQRGPRRERRGSRDEGMSETPQPFRASHRERRGPPKERRESRDEDGSETPRPFRASHTERRGPPRERSEFRDGDVPETPRPFRASHTERRGLRRERRETPDENVSETPRRKRDY